MKFPGWLVLTTVAKLSCLLHNLVASLIPAELPSLELAVVAELTSRNLSAKTDLLAGRRAKMLVGVASTPSVKASTMGSAAREAPSSPMTETWMHDPLPHDVREGTGVCGGSTDLGVLSVCGRESPTTPKNVAHTCAQLDPAPSIGELDENSFVRTVSGFRCRNAGGFHHLLLRVTIPQLVSRTFINNFAIPKSDRRRNTARW